MRTPKLGLLLAAIVVAGAFVALVPTASAQQSSSITVVLTPPSENVKPLQGPVTISGTVTLTTDQSAFTGIIGVPVAYTVTKQPAWATVLVSPASDVFPIGQPAAGTSANIPKTITVTVTASDQAPAFQADQIEITATTTPRRPASPRPARATSPSRPATSASSTSSSPRPSRSSAPRRPCSSP